MTSDMKDFDSRWSQIADAFGRIFSENFPNSKDVLDNLPGIMESVKKVRLTDDRASRKLGLDFLDEAERDIQSCRALYSKKIYPHAAYHFQQAVEKATKAYVLGFGFLSRQEIKTHDTPKLFLRALFEKTGIKSLADQLGDEHFRTLIGNAYAAIDDDEQRQAIARTSYENIRTHLTQINGYRVVAERVSGSFVQETSTIIGAELPPLPPLFQAMSAMVTLFVLAAISFPHVEYTRYPDREITPPEYKISLGIVRAIPKMTKLLQAEIQQMSKVLSQESG